MRTKLFLAAMAFVLVAAYPHSGPRPVPPAPPSAQAHCPSATIAQAYFPAGIACAISPNATDPAVANFFPGDPNIGFGYHVVALPNRPPVGAIVFFVGSGQQPYGPRGFEGRAFISEALNAGFVLIMPAYANRIYLQGQCGNNLACYGPAHQRIVTGTGASSVAFTNIPNSVDFRLQALARFLHRQLPSYAWPDAIGNDGINWNQAFVGGLSLGGGTAAWIAQRSPVGHVCYLSAVLDGQVVGAKGVPATWLRNRFATPGTSMAGLVHIADPAYVKEIASFQAMGLPARSQFVTTLPESDPHVSTFEDPRLAPYRDAICL